MIEAHIRQAMTQQGYEPAQILVNDSIHRFDIDRKGNKVGWYIFRSDGHNVWGAFGDWRSGEKHTFFNKPKNEMSAQEKLDMKKKQEAMRRRLDRERKNAADMAREKAAKIVDKMQKVASHSYLGRKSVKQYTGTGVYYKSFIVPCYTKGELSGVQMIAESGIKRFIKGAPMKGAYFILGDVENASQILVAEGYSTAASLHESTNLPCVVAFNASNLVDVGKYFHNLYADKTLIFCADQDDSHIGEDKAIEAAGKCKGVVRICPIRGDYNDLFCSEGPQAVYESIFPPVHDVPDDVPDDAPLEPLCAPFRVLGRNAGVCYYLPADGHIHAYAPAAHTKTVLLNLAPLEYWQSIYPPDDGHKTFELDAALSDLLRQSEALTFDPALKRGRGAWLEKSRVIVHQGTTVLDVATGEQTNVLNFPSHHIYSKKPPLVRAVKLPLNNKDASKVLDMCKLLPIANPVYAYLLSGWIVCAQVCGVLPWRPHLWITGRRGSGKSYTLNNIVYPLLRDNCIHVQSTTTEAGIRQTLQDDAMAVLFDEAEGTGQREKDRLQRVLELARQASSEGGGKIAKGTAGGAAMSFEIRSAFCFSSISSSVTQNSDRSRISTIEIDKNRYGSPETFHALESLASSTLSPDFAAGFYWRCVRNAAIIRKNAQTFSQVAGIFFGDRRAGDQIGTLLAGAFSLTSHKELTADQCMDWLKDRQEEDAWEALFQEIEEQSDEEQLLASILQGHVLYEGKPRAVWAMLEDLENQESSVHSDAIKQALSSFGLRYEYGRLHVANKNDNLKKMLKDTPFTENWGRMLQRLPNSHVPTCPKKFAGHVSRCTTIELL